MKLLPQSFPTHLLYTVAFSLLLSVPPRSLVFPFASASVFAVGGDEGWVVGAVNYSDWAANYTFYAGDSLVFNYLPEVHTVLQVTRGSYTNCDVANPTASYDNGNTTVHLNLPGSYYFICGVYQHCPLGQKLEVVALKILEEAPSPSPAPTAGAPDSALKSHSSPSRSPHSGVRTARSTGRNAILLHTFLLVSCVLL